MTDIIETLVKRDPRYHVVNDDDLIVKLQKRDDSFETIQATLANISGGGAKFKANEVLSVKEVLAVKIESKRTKRTITVSGEVCWVTPVAGDDWWLGCAFKPPIPNEVLHEFAEAGILERREHRRKGVSLDTTAKWELNNEPAAVVIIDYSRGGFCLLSQAAGKTGERILLQFESDEGRNAQVRGKAQWQVESHDGFIIGCEFARSRDFAVLCDLIDSTPSGEEKSRSARRRLGPQIPANTIGSDREESKKRRSFVRCRSCIIAFCMAVLLWAVIHRSDNSESVVEGHAVGTLSVETSPQPTPRSIELHRYTGETGMPLFERSLSPSVPTNTSTAPVLQEDLRSVVAASALTRKQDFEHVDTNEGKPTLGRLVRTPRSHQEFDVLLSAKPRLPLSTGRPNHERAVDAFRQGRVSYDLQQYQRATEALWTAIQNDSTNAAYFYFLAMAQYQLKQYEQAEQSVKKAVELERLRKVEAWGKTMESYQGDVRIWLEETRDRLSGA